MTGFADSLIKFGLLDGRFLTENGGSSLGVASDVRVQNTFIFSEKNQRAPAISVQHNTAGFTGYTDSYRHVEAPGEGDK
ncbi:hypothetical protein [Cedecea davisae]|uniref:hypothetical protein n=1 Tax=Cedecea davisae TaxID=158484 RepID=UPI0024320CB2|nr:hypothetical protein [Cedecea davisae]